MRGSFVRSVGLLLGVALLAPAAGGQANPLPRQDIVFVIDNSGSMEGPNGADPLRLRGVAANLILDAAELASQLQAGLVFFSTNAQEAAPLGPPDAVRQKMQADRLPPAEGATNMEEALNRALAMLNGSAAAIKKVVLITDGTPSGLDGKESPAQAKAILDRLVPAASAAGIQVFSLGFGSGVNQDLLEQITTPTTGQAVIADTHRDLLEAAKRLISERDNVFTLEQRMLGNSQTEVSFEIPAGADSSRVTLILDSPDVFAADEIQFELKGPEGGTDRPYTVQKDAKKRVAAWTTFLSTPGSYTLRIEVTKPGATGHMGAQLFVEALSLLQAEIVLQPDQDRYTFGDQVKVRVLAAGGSGTLAPGSARTTGDVRTSTGGAQAIAFQGEEGMFEVPAVAGRHVVEVAVETSQQLGRVTATREYRAVPPDAAVLSSSRAALELAKPLGPDHPSIEDTFTLSAAFPEGRTPRRLKFAATTSALLTAVELVRADGTVLVADGTRDYPLPVEGLELTVRLSLHPDHPLRPEDVGPQEGELRITSPDADELIVPFRFTLRLPRFELSGGRAAFALWWDPARPRSVSVGSIESDLSESSSFTVSVPRAVHVPGGPKIADLALRIGDQTPEPQHQGDRLLYGPLELPPGEEIPIWMVVQPVAGGDWEAQPASIQPILLQARSSLGMEDDFATELRTLGGAPRPLPILGPWSRHGRHVASALTLGGGLLLLTLGTWRRGRRLWRFRHFRPGALRPLAAGGLGIGDDATAGQAALRLPNSGSALDETILGEVTQDARGQTLRDTSGGRLRFGESALTAPQRLAPGSLIGVVDPDDEDERLWELEYFEFDPADGGEVEVLTSPVQGSAGGIAGKLLLGLGVLLVLRLMLDSDWAGSLAYWISPLESLYLTLFTP